MVDRAMSNFRQALAQFAEPGLTALGYEYDEVLREKNVLYGFERNLGGDIWGLLLCKPVIWWPLPISTRQFGASILIPVIP